MGFRAKIKNISDNPHPVYANAGDAGMDIRAYITEGDRTLVLHPGESKIIPTGIFVELPDGYEAQIRPRSGLAAKYGITVLNSPGTIEGTYRGEWGIILINHSLKSFEIKTGDRIAQVVFNKFETLEGWDDVVEFSETKRGAGGFGHTGVK